MKDTWEKSMGQKGELRNKQDRDRKDSLILKLTISAYDESKTSHPI